MGSSVVPFALSWRWIFVVQGRAHKTEEAQEGSTKESAGQCRLNPRQEIAAKRRALNE
jgi:hypothetical protein